MKTTTRSTAQRRSGLGTIARANGRVIVGLLTMAAACLTISGPASAAVSVPASAAVDVTLNSRTYFVFASTIKAFDETGPINSGISDEVFGGFRTSSVSGEQFVAQSKLFGDFDAGQTRTYPSDQSCLSDSIANRNSGQAWLSGLEGDAWSCARPINAPFTVEASLWESDTWLQPTCVPGICGFAPIGPHPLGPGNKSDDHIGDRTVSFSSHGLAADLPTVGSGRFYSTDFFGSGGHYRLTLMVYRAA
jgi:hypothetical protein